MKSLISLLGLAVFLSLFPSFSFAQNCDDSIEVTVKITIGTDGFPYENSWDLVGLDGTVYGAVQLDATYTPNSVYTWEVCLPIGACAVFTIYDAFGDGMEAPGFYAIEVDGLEVESSVLTGASAKFSVNCGLGIACNSAELVTLGTYETERDNAWYAFSPENSGQYRVGTCNLASCDTKIWIFSDCANAHNNEDNQGTMAYGDNTGNCGEQAEVFIALPATDTIYIRIGDDNDACGGAPINWELEYLGAISGCTDPSACNYSPLATIDDGSCIAFGDTTCPSPDLVVREDILITSAYLDQIEVTDDCLITEGCLKGYGLRDILRFSTRIENIGNADFFVGVPGIDDALFTFDNCHNHWHYNGYAEYVLYDTSGLEIPIGFKNGFCVIDLGCQSGGIARYSCDYMGISAGCYDEYMAGFECQWIDVTDVPDGRYTFVTRVNWGNSPDALGRKEIDTLNNWAQMCIILDRSSGSLEFIQDDNCEVFVDCNGIPYGDTQFDCAGVCGGTAVWGDLNTDGELTVLDAEAFIAGLTSDTLSVSSCNDLSGDGEISIYDAALMVDCAIYGEDYQTPSGGMENHCIFPHFLLNPNDSVGLTILEANIDDNYIDIGIKNTTTNILGYQFYLTGLNITAVENLVDSQLFPISPEFGAGGMIVGLSLEDSLILRSNEWKPLVRVYHDGNVNGEVCISDIREMVNENYELTNRYLDRACITISSLDIVDPQLQVRIFPNPFANQTRLVFSNPEKTTYELRILDISGRVLRTMAAIDQEEVWIEAGDLAKGIYLLRIDLADGNSLTTKFMVNR